jgi:hypothetical protein
VEAIEGDDLGERLLHALARYRLLTIQQAHEYLALHRDRSRIGDELRKLTRLGYVRKYTQQRNMAGPDIHWLTPKGARETAQLASARAGRVVIVSPPRLDERPRTAWPLRQRLATVECRFLFELWADNTGGRLERFEAEFDPHPSGKLEKALELEWQRVSGEAATYAPDAAGIIRLSDSTRTLFALEVETGGEGGSIGNYTLRLPDRLGAFEDFALERAWNWDGERAARLLFVLRLPEMLRPALKVLGKMESEARVQTFFATIDGIKTDIASAWVDWEGKNRSPFRSQ